MAATAAQEAGPDKWGDQPSEVYRAALSYAEHGWPVLPGSTWAGRRFVVPGTLRITDGPRPLVARNCASSDLETVARWWSADKRMEPSVLLRSGEAFNLVSVAFELADAALGTMAARAQAGPVLYQPDQGRAYFLVQCGGLLSGQFGKPDEVAAIAPGEWIAAPPTYMGTSAKVRWWYTPEAATWCPPDIATLAEALTAAVRNRTTPST